MFKTSWNKRKCSISVWIACMCYSHTRKGLRMPNSTTYMASSHHRGIHCVARWVVLFKPLVVSVLIIHFGAKEVSNQCSIQLTIDSDGLDPQIRKFCFCTQIETRCSPHCRNDSSMNIWTSYQVLQSPFVFNGRLHSNLNQLNNKMHVFIYDWSR